LGYLERPDCFQRRCEILLRQEVCKKCEIPPMNAVFHLKIFRGHGWVDSSS
jgi:hypothetical protein